MRVLLIHNRYQQKGGEDTVFQAEHNLLARYGNRVETLVFDNKHIRTAADKWLAGIKAIYNVRAANQIKEMIGRFNPEVIHVHNFFPLISPAVFYAARGKNIPTVFTLHNYRLICPSAYLFHNDRIYEKSMRHIFPIDAVMRGVYRNSRLQTTSVALMTAFHNLAGTWRNKVDTYIVLSHFAKKLFVNSALKLPEKKIVTKPNFVEDTGVGKQQRDDSFLFVGRLSPEKGIRTLLRAAAIYPFKLDIIGDGLLKEEVMQYAAAHDNITYLGYREKPEVIRALKKSKALIFPSLWYECWPMVIMEAFSCGTPVIASNLGSMPEAVRHKGNGLLFETGNEIDLIDKIIEMGDMPHLAEALGAEARLTYKYKYTPEVNYDMLMDIYVASAEKKAHAYAS